METMTKDRVRALLPHRPADGHKGTFGKVYVLGGTAGYTGAPVFAGEAAVRTGSGLVYAGVPREVYPIVAARCTCAMAQPVPEEDGELLERLRAYDAVCIGPGLGPELQRTVPYLLQNLTCPVVLDAGGINAAALHIDVLAERKAPTVVTPHDGEFRRLGGNPEEPAAEFAARYGCVLVRKGPETVVAAPDGRQIKHSCPNSGMAKGGSGDVLAGMILSLLGQGAEAFEAAAAAVWMHSRAGILCVRELSEYAMTPADLIERLPAVFRELVMETCTVFR